MDVHIQEVVSTVRAVDSQSVLSPRMLETIVGTVMQALRAERVQEERLKKERRVTSGVRDEEEGEA